MTTAPWSLNLTETSLLQAVDRSQSAAKPTALRDVKKRIGYEARVALAQIMLVLAPGRRVPQPVVTITPPTPIALHAPSTCDAPDVCDHVSLEDLEVVLPARSKSSRCIKSTWASGLPPTVRGRSRKRGSWRSGLRSRLGSRDGLCYDDREEGLGLVSCASRQDGQDVGLMGKTDLAS